MQITSSSVDLLTSTRFVENGIFHFQFSFITREEVAKKVFDTIAPKYADRNGGYTRVTRTGARRGDAAEMAIIELV